ncbi:hypothetical protein [Paenibacillus sp. NPDC057967]|uniref:hypothetical protein n=1 Tax=Paenibacillus sp. NPDC057967 TaxID=3346293 RepID=UPI0036DD1622
MIDFQVFAKRGRLVDLGLASLVFVLIGVLMVVLAPQINKPGEGVLLTVFGIIGLLLSKPH